MSLKTFILPLTKKLLELSTDFPVWAGDLPATSDGESELTLLTLWSRLGCSFLLLTFCWTSIVSGLFD